MAALQSDEQTENPRDKKKQDLIVHPRVKAAAETPEDGDTLATHLQKNLK